MNIKIPGLLDVIDMDRQTMDLQLNSIVKVKDDLLTFVPHLMWILYFHVCIVTL